MEVLRKNSTLKLHIALTAVTAVRTGKNTETFS
jgi:hypothetical protein